MFRLYAFEVKQPPTKPMTLSCHIVDTIGGLPLTLQIVGSYLKGKMKAYKLRFIRKLGTTNVSRHSMLFHWNHQKNCHLPMEVSQIGPSVWAYSLGLSGLL